LSADAGTGAVVRPTGLPTRSIGNAALWIAVFLGGFVFIEPSPYEYALAVIIPLWMLLGFRVPRALSPLVVLMILFLTGGILSAPQATNYEAQPIYIAVTIFLALSAVFYASLTSDGPDRMNVAVNAWIAAALATSILGILGYLG
jgi:hypothetical protein